MPEFTGSRIALLPLDDRPVNIDLPQDVARIAGLTVEVPPAEILPKYRVAGDPLALGEWLTDRANDPAIQHLIVSLDMLCYGGLIASRTSVDSTRDALAQLDVLRRIRKAHPEVKINAVALVMRASNSYSAAEEPDYWASYGKEIHQLGGEIHRQDGEADVAPLDEITNVPPHIVADFALRRARNHIVNLAALALVQDGTLDFLAITADDTAEFSAGSAEQAWLRHWMRFLPSGREVLMYPGADEVGAVLVARVLSGCVEKRPTVRVTCPEPGGLERIPPYENVPLEESINRQVRAAGAYLVEDNPDVVLVIHAPDPERHDMFRGYPPTEDSVAIDRTVTALMKELDAGHTVALADVRYPNGSDAGLMWRLKEANLLGRLTSFGGWNTAGNTLGTVIAMAVAFTVGKQTGRIENDAVHRALLTRLLDDFAYQSVIRTEDGPSLFPDHLPMTDDTAVEHAATAIRDRMSTLLANELPADGWVLDNISLPWKRSFEVRISLRSPSELPSASNADV
jgi:hypothetical protein